MKAAKTGLLWLLLALMPLQGHAALSGAHCRIAASNGSAVHHHHAGMVMADAATSVAASPRSSHDQHAHHAASSSWCAQACAAAGSGALIASLPAFVSVIAHDSPRVSAAGTTRDALPHDLLRPPTALS